MIEKLLINSLKNSSQSVATAESCTGGFLAHRLTNVVSAAGVFQYGLVVYSNEAKQDLLGIPRQLLDHFGAVSAEVAIAMAENIRKKSGATFGLSTTGFAGPEGGTPEKPVGTVFLAIACEEKETEVWLEFFPEKERLLFKEKVTELLLQRLYAKIIAV